MDSSLKRIIKLIKKTGDRFIVTDSDYELPYVVMSLEEYENLVLANEEIAFNPEEMNEGQLLEKINRDIAIWKSQQEKLDETLESFRQEEQKQEDVATVAAPILTEKTLQEEEEEGGEDRYYFEPLET